MQNWNQWPAGVPTTSAVTSAPPPAAVADPTTMQAYTQCYNNQTVSMNIFF